MQFFTFQVKLFRRLLLNIPLQSIQSRLVAVLVFSEHVVEEGDVADGQLERIHFAQPLLVRQGWNVGAESFESFVYRLHAPTFAKVGGVSLLGLLGCTFHATVFRYSSEWEEKKSFLIAMNEFWNFCFTWDSNLMIIFVFVTKKNQRRKMQHD